jgi:8-oxo-dGTP diphosphatase
VKHYCLGFVFDEELEHVVLLEKNRPPWQAGKVNGVGGHVQPGESYLESMRREFREEAGADIPEVQWVAFCGMTGTAPEVERPDCENLDWTCMCFAARLKLSDFDCVVTKTDEQIVLVEVTNLDTEMVPIDNVRWMIPAAIEALKGGELTLRARYRLPGVLQNDSHVRP